MLNTTNTTEQRRLDATMRLHLRIAAAYEAVGDHENAEMAREAARRCATSKEAT